MTSVQRSQGYNYEDYVPVQNIVCPICDMPCTSLQALNVHLDTKHTEEDTTGALLSWFRTAHKKVQTTLNASSSSSLSVSPRSPPSGSSNGNAVERSLKQLIDPAIMNSFSNLSLGNGSPTYFASDQDRQNEVYVTREHWQREGSHDSCALPGCGKRAGKQHCRQCGKLFCDPHMQYEMKLDAHARHDPENGVWCRVCRGCYIGRPDYVEHRGVTRSLTAQFLKKRSKTIDRVHLESNRLEKRLEKLARIHHHADTGGSPHRNSSPNPSLASLSLERTESTSSKESSLGSVMSPRSGFVSNGNSILSMKLKYRDGEQSVTKWEDDKSVVQCPLCASTFTITNRKHHCRLCGRIVCGNIRCSKMIPLFINMSSDFFDEEPVGDTRACRDCQRAVFRRKLRHEEAMHPMPIIQLYHQLTLTRQNIEKLLPRFHDIILIIDKEKITHQSKETYQTAAKIRKSLLDSFALYDTLAKSIKTLPARSPSFRRLQANVCTAASMYLQQNMLPLQMLPRILKPEKHATNGHHQHHKANGKSSSSSSSPPSPPMKRQDLLLQLQAFQEQEKLVEGFIRDAQHARKFDDVKTLKISMAELHDEIARIRSELGE
ncbi:FYVE zinc finger-domain-containing protein [Zychaea mexicana]|uniref:FYVE zinc finger-domain-containing protein n=1 Tax=Zychaea mexicana TaxID=64656 RepID=UPI0022FE83B8|nr:FYVE zinc finger-domain-containing protein [Zychaea mexicana]KAI9493191.1 FYVE zinc finger-domain-containing protein [Zychaea mexicana]